MIRFVSFVLVSREPEIKTNIEYEFEEYEKDMGEKENFWPRNRSNYPILFALAKRILTIPATSSGPEGHFSVVGKVTNPERSLLKPETLSMQSFVACNILKYQ